MKDNLINISGITEQDERKGNLENYEYDFDESWMDKTILEQLKADRTCPKCGMKSSKTGECSYCGFEWTPPLFH